MTNSQAGSPQMDPGEMVTPDELLQKIGMQQMIIEKKEAKNQALQRKVMELEQRLATLSGQAEGGGGG